jgi:O-antigen ligase
MEMTAKMTMSVRNFESTAMIGDVRARARLARIADGLVAAIAVSLPWSTSATGILVVLWLIALVPTLDPASVRREVMSAAGGLPLLLWGLGVAGMLWADLPWADVGFKERIAGMSGFHKLLLVPLLLAQFRRSGQAQWAFLGFLASSVLLLVVSWVLVLAPGLTWRGRSPGVPVKDYIFQSSIFAICAFGLIGQVGELWRTRTRLPLGRALGLALGLALLAAAFIANIVYVATARTTLVVMAVLLLLLGLRQFRWRGALVATVVGGVLTGGAWTSSPYLRERVSLAIEQVRGHGTADVNTSVGLRLEYWQKSLAFIAEAPVIGHGTGTIPQLFRRDATADTIPELLTTNPHSQVLTVAIQLGLIGALALIAMWIAHLALFRGGTLIAWFGLVVAVQNVVGSFFNSYLFDFSQGWLYVLGVGIAGGMVLRAAPGAAKIEERAEDKR